MWRGPRDPAQSLERGWPGCAAAEEAEEACSVAGASSRGPAGSRCSGADGERDERRVRRSRARWSTSDACGCSPSCCWGCTEHTKLGEGTLYSCPEKSNVPSETLNRKTLTLSESWLAAMSHWPEASNAKCRGVRPRTCRSHVLLRAPGWGRSWTRKIAMLSWPSFDTATKSPEAWTRMQLQALPEPQKASGMVRTVCRRRRVGTSAPAIRSWADFAENPRTRTSESSFTM
mmetsp:Transcript_62558/g.135548  ORF Transcript_62558/g.135548 Transcript_62558/m.135548 type:complete len:231 (-) Transcript_62558:741-1433(-)